MTELVSSINLAKEWNIPHKNLLRTIKRFLSFWLNDEIIEHLFKNKMNITFKWYLLTERVVWMLETIYLFKWYWDDKTKIQSYWNITTDIVYILTDNNWKFKIGTTSNLKNRLTAIQIWNPNFIEVFAIIKWWKEIEKEIHLKFKDKHINWEWFNINYEDIQELRIEYWHKFNYIDTLSWILSEINLIHSNFKEISVKNINITNKKSLVLLKNKLLNLLSKENSLKDFLDIIKKYIN